MVRARSSDLQRKYCTRIQAHLTILARSKTFTADQADLLASPPSNPQFHEMQADQQWTYSSLTEALHHRTIILRVHTTPHNPLESGFTARNPVFRGLTVEQYHHATASLKGERWAEGPYMRDVIIDHINQLIRRPQPQQPGNMGNGWLRQPPPHIRYQGRQRQNVPLKEEVDELSPWISTTANLDWALWYITKLLALPGNGPRNNPGMKHNTVKLAIISISTDRTYNKELYVAPFLWRPPDETRYMCQVDRERYNRAKKSAISAKEVLFYGRIFNESILADLTFTKEVSISSLHYRMRNDSDISGTMS